MKSAAPQKSNRGPRKKAQHPPRRGESSTTVWSPPLDAAFQQELADLVGLQSEPTHQQLVELAADATEALHDTAHMAVTTLPKLPGERREWCETIASLSRDLAAGLGVQQDNPDGGLAFWLTHANLEPGIGEFAACADSQHRLAVAVPSMPPDPPEDAILKLLGRMTPALLSLAAIAEAAKAHWATQVQRGGSDADEPRRLLMSRLVDIYQRMFGRDATVVMRYDPDATARTHQPGGPAVAWFTAFFAAVARRLDGVENSSAAALLRIARDATTSQHGDSVAGWLRDVRQSGKSTFDKR